jgi:hypothetical protein
LVSYNTVVVDLDQVVQDGDYFVIRFHDVSFPKPIKKSYLKPYGLLKKFGKSAV